MAEYFLNTGSTTDWRKLLKLVPLIMRQGIDTLTHIECFVC